MKAGIKKEYIILAVIIVVLLAFLLFQDQDKLHYKIPKLDPVKKEDIDKVEIKQQGKIITLVKKNEKWSIVPQGYPTEAEKVNKIVETLAQLTLTDLISKVKNYNLYDLTEDKAIQVKAFQKDKTLRDFEVGKMAPTYGHTFVKLSADPNVYLARESFRNNFELKMNDLRDKSVMKLDSNEISEIQLEKEGKTYVLAKKVKPVEASPVPSVSPGDKKAAEEKKPGDKAAEIKPAEEPKKPEEEITWLTPEGKKGNKSQVDGLIGQIANLTCDEYIEDKTIEDFKAQVPIYTVKVKGAKDYILSFFSKVERKESEDSPGGQSYQAISSETPYPFLLSTWKADQIMKKPEDLIEGLIKKEEKKEEKKVEKKVEKKPGNKK